MNIEELIVRYYFEQLLQKLDLDPAVRSEHTTFILNSTMTGAALTEEYDTVDFDEEK